MGCGHAQEERAVCSRVPPWLPGTSQAQSVLCRFPFYPLLRSERVRGGGMSERNELTGGCMWFPSESKW